MAIELDRCFVECREGAQSDPDVIAQYGLTDGSLGWTDLLTRRRVVFLAEAGSGKTTEMKARSRLLADSGQPAFYATVEDVGRKGLERALRPADRPALAAWRSSEEEGWLFIDSVDEAKQSGLRLRTALHAIAEAIMGAERRTHVVLSGRYTDWQFRGDLIHFREELGIPADEALPPPPTPDELVISTIYRERRHTSAASSARLMRPLAKSRIRRHRDIAGEA
ncbi:MAG: hypothetical protein ACXWLB_02925 [Reyranella sp.]